jgi:hypothetical protein
MSERTARISEERHVDLRDKTVVKSADPRLMRIEVEKTRRGGWIGKESGLFRVPEVLDHDETRGVAVFERIVGLESLYLAASWGREYVSLAGRIGTLLAVIHRDLTLPQDMVVPLPADFIADGQDVFFHGDFGVENICLDRRTSSLVVLDWQFTSVHGGGATYGSRYFDIIWFVNNLLWSPTMRHLIGNPIRPVAREFVESYYRLAGIPYDAAGISDYAEHFFETKRPARRPRSGRQRLFFPRCQALTRHFIRSLRTEILP